MTTADGVPTLVVGRDTVGWSVATAAVTAAWAVLAAAVLVSLAGGPCAVTGDRARAERATAALRSTILTAARTIRRFLRIAIHSAMEGARPPANEYNARRTRLTRWQQ